MMKRFLMLVLMLLLLCGCGSAPDQIHNSPEESRGADSTEPAGCYEPDSKLETVTGGAVRVYPMERKDVHDLALMGNDLLAFSGKDRTTITKLSGNNLYTTAVVDSGCYVNSYNGSLHTCEKGTVYYDEGKKQIVYLDTNLKEVNRVDVPNDIVGCPIISSDRKALYYCTADSVQVMDLENKLHKLLKEMSNSYQSAMKLHMKDTILECTVENAEGKEQSVFISTQNGQTVYQSGSIFSLTTNEDRFFAAVTDHAAQEFLLGNAEGVTAAFVPRNQVTYACAVPGADGVLTACKAEKADSTLIEYYNLRDGKRKAMVELPGTDYPTRVYSRGDENQLWLLRYDAEYDSMVVYCWDLTKSAVEDDQVYTGKRFTADDPDVEGLKMCKETAAEIGEHYGVEISVWTDATATQPKDYTLATAYQVTPIRKGLEQLDAALSKYPEGFLKKTGSASANGKIKICLVGSITGEGHRPMDGLQYWDEDNNAYIALTLSNDMEQNVYHEICHVIDNRVFAHCSAYDNWDILNPKGFQYDYSYVAHVDQNDSVYLENETRAFIDSYAMSYPKEDRARIMEYAMVEGNESYFTSSVMQKKLHQICQGIRKAYGLQKSPEEFLWERYLSESLAYKE